MTPNFIRPLFNVYWFSFSRWTSVALGYCLKTIFRFFIAISETESHGLKPMPYANSITLSWSQVRRRLTPYNNIAIYAMFIHVSRIIIIRVKDFYYMYPIWLTMKKLADSNVNNVRNLNPKFYFARICIFIKSYF